MDHKVSTFLEDLKNRTADLQTSVNLASWDMALTGSEASAKQWQELTLNVRRIFGDEKAFKEVKEMYEKRADLKDPSLRRQLEIVYTSYLAEQQNPDQVEELTRLEAEVEMIYNNYRGNYRGQKLTDNELSKILEYSRDSDEVKEAYLASKEVGGQVADKVLKLVDLRNEAAKRVGYDNFYLRSLATQELNEAELFKLMEQLEAATRTPYRDAKAHLDANLLTKFGLKDVTDLRPWHYADFFFQRTPAGENDPLAGLFHDGKEIEQLALKTYDGLGLEIRDVLARSDLYERDGKSQHAFANHIDRRTDDVRILCNIQPTTRWMETTLHEFGHAVYDKYLATDLPYWLRSAAHISTTEAIAMLMGRLATNESWLSKVKGLSQADLESRLQILSANQRFGLLVFMRWGLVMVHFERDMYANPHRSDLNKLWWDYVEKFQLLARPDDRSAPDWAAKIHLAVAPAYYQNYILGELTASQLQAYVEREVEGKSLVENKHTGKYLRKLFSLGATYDWNETIKQVTGENLNPAYFVAQAAS